MGRLCCGNGNRRRLAVQVLERHGKYVTGIAVHSDGRRLYSISNDTTLRVWDKATGVQIEELPQRNAVSCVAVCAENHMIALGFADGTLKVLDCETKGVAFEDTEAHKTRLCSVSFDLSRSYAATGSRDRTIRVWETHSWARVVSCKGHGEYFASVSLCPDAKKKIASASYNGTIRLWDAEPGKDIGMYLKMTGPILSITFTGDGDRSLSCSANGFVQIWNARLQTDLKEKTHAHSDLALAVAVSQDGMRVSSASRDGTVCLWDAQTGVQTGPRLEGHTRGLSQYSAIAIYCNIQ